MLKQQISSTRNIAVWTFSKQIRASVGGGNGQTTLALGLGETASILDTADVSEPLPLNLPKITRAGKTTTWSTWLLWKNKMIEVCYCLYLYCLWLLWLWFILEPKHLPKGRFETCCSMLLIPNVQLGCGRKLSQLRRFHVEARCGRQRGQRRHLGTEAQRKFGWFFLTWSKLLFF